MMTQDQNQIYFFSYDKKMRFIILFRATYNYLSIISIVIADALLASNDVFFRIVR